MKRHSKYYHANTIHVTHFMGAVFSINPGTTNVLVTVHDETRWFHTLGSAPPRNKDTRIQILTKWAKEQIEAFRLSGSARSFS